MNGGNAFLVGWTQGGVPITMSCSKQSGSGELENPTGGGAGKQNGRTVETAVEARAGFLDRPVFVVLVASVAAVVVAFFLTYLGVVKL